MASRVVRIPLEDYKSIRDIMKRSNMNFMSSYYLWKKKLMKEKDWEEY